MLRRIGAVLIQAYRERKCAEQVLQAAVPSADQNRKEARRRNCGLGTHTAALDRKQSGKKRSGCQAMLPLR